MDASDLLAIANGSVHDASRQNALSWARRFAVSRRRDRTQKNPSGLLALARETHIEHMNRTKASRRDDVMLVDPTSRPIVNHGSGKWKQLLPTQILRNTFDKDPATAMSSIAAACGSSARYVIDCAFLCARRLLCKQEQSVGTLFGSDADFSGGFVSLQLSWDETKFKIRPQGEKNTKASSVSTLAMHGHFLWSVDGSFVSEDEVVLKPMAITSTTAAHMSNAIQQVLPGPLLSIWKGDAASLGTRPPKMISLNLGSDHAASNLMLMAHVSAQMPDNTVVFAGLCKQHASGLCMAPVIRHLDIASPTFCVAKIFRGDGFLVKFRDGLRAAIRASPIRLIRQQDQPNFQPDPADKQYAESVLELAYYHRDLRSRKDEDDVQRLMEQDKVRRQRGAELLSACPGNWRERPITHWCSECADDEAAIEHVFLLATSVAFGVLGIPALNKWLSMWPLISDITMAFCFHRIFVDAMRHALNISEDEAAAGYDSASESELLGQPGNQAWHRQERRRALRALAWIEHRDTPWKLMLYLLTVGPVMRLHYTLFKYAQASPRGESLSYLFDLCDMRKSVAAHILGQLTSMLLSGDRWGPLLAMLGSTSWPSRCKSTAGEIALMLYAQVWRRLIQCYTSWPWRLVPLAHPDISQERKEDIARAFFQAPDQTLDRASRKIRACAGSPEALLEEFWQQFLFHTFNKVVISTAYIESLFAHYKQWMLPSNKPWSVPLLQAKHVNSSFTRGTSLKRKLAAGADADGAEAKRARVMTRPAWVVKRGELGRQNSRHMFIGAAVRDRPLGKSPRAAFSDAVVEWRGAGSDKKRASQQTASGRQIQAKQLKEDHLKSVNLELDHAESPWNVADGTRFPLPPHDLEAALATKSGVNDAVAQWVLGGIRVDRDPTFPEAVEYDRPLTEAALSLTEAQKLIANAIVDTFALLFAPRGIGNRKTESFLMAVDSGSGVRSVLRRCACLKSSPLTGEFTGEFLMYRFRDIGSEWHEGALVLPCDLEVASSPLAGVEGAPEGLLMLTEQELAIKIALRGDGPWRFHRIVVDDNKKSTNLLAAQLMQVRAEVDLDEERATVRAIAASNRALKLLKATQQQRQARPRGGVRPRGTGGRRQRGLAGHAVAVAGKADGDESLPQEPADLFRRKDLVEDESDHDSSDEEIDEAYTLWMDKVSSAEKKDLALAAAAATAAAAAASSGSQPHTEAEPHPGASGGSLPRPVDNGRVPEASGTRSCHVAPDEQQRLEQYPIGDYGYIKVDVKRKQLNAHCAQGFQGAEPSHRTETTPECRMNRVCKKKPLGLLVAWLRSCRNPTITNRMDHKLHACLITLSERKEARAWLESQPELRPLLAFEAECNGAEHIEEPEFIV